MIITAAGASFTQSGTSCSACIRCASKAMLPPQKCTPSSAPMKASWKTMPAKTAPSDSKASGTSIVQGLSCG